VNATATNPAATTPLFRTEPAAVTPLLIEVSELSYLYALEHLAAEVDSYLIELTETNDGNEIGLAQFAQRMHRALREDGFRHGALDMTALTRQHLSRLIDAVLVWQDDLHDPDTEDPWLVDEELDREVSSARGFLRQRQDPEFRSGFGG
jgi:hypothetical protein